jgi:RHS repeat-associated protein
MRVLFLLLAFASFVFANITTKTIINTPYAQVITESKEDGTSVEYTYGNDLLNDGTHYFLTDALGSTRELVDDSEALTDSYTYTPYGKLISHDGDATNSFLFTGEQYDSEIKSYYLRARYYNPNIARFLSRDTYDGTQADPLSQNHYLYAGGNPVIYVDPSGHENMMTLSHSIYIRGTFAGIRGSRLEFSSEAVKKMLVMGTKKEIHSVVVDLIENFVFAELKGARFKGKDAGVTGSRAHKLLEKRIGKYKPFGKYVTLKAEVFYDKDKNPTKRNKAGSLGVDIQVIYKGKVVVVLDLKTSKRYRGFTKSTAIEIGRRNGNVPVIEIFIPFL